jgi:hypothetical protein
VTNVLSRLLLWVLVALCDRAQDLFLLCGHDVFGSVVEQLAVAAVNPPWFFSSWAVWL